MSGKGRWRPTANQRKVLECFPLEGIEQRLSVPMVATACGTNTTGVAETAASLIRRGLLARHHDRSGKVFYYRPPPRD